ncbi:GNAT family N-acetyltransferase [Limibacter armeniacum]|uniref:GNAT family N-acetyltransferase n=1 Tax=Limibacter armeniacum TaxID=466084 RepID=UPI002FE50A2F
MDFLIEKATAADTQAICHVVTTVLLEYNLKPDFNSTDQDLLDIPAFYLNNNGYFGIIRNLDCKVVGTFGLFAISEDICEVRKMYLLPEARKMGLGQKMLQILLDEAKKRHFKKVQLETASVLKEAIGLYKKFGFKEIQPTHLASRCDQAFELELT